MSIHFAIPRLFEFGSLIDSAMPEGHDANSTGDDEEDDEAMYERYDDAKFYRDDEMYGDRRTYDDDDDDDDEPAVYGDAAPVRALYQFAPRRYVDVRSAT